MHRKRRSFRVRTSPGPRVVAVLTCPSPVLRSSTWRNRPSTRSPRPSSRGATGRSAEPTFVGRDGPLRLWMSGWGRMRRRRSSISAIRPRSGAGGSPRTGSRPVTAAGRSRSRRRSGTAEMSACAGGRAFGGIGTASSSLRHAWNGLCTSANRSRFRRTRRRCGTRRPRWGCRWRSDAVVRCPALDASRPHGRCIGPAPTQRFLLRAMNSGDRRGRATAHSRHPEFHVGVRSMPHIRYCIIIYIVLSIFHDGDDP